MSLDDYIIYVCACVCMNLFTTVLSVYDLRMVVYVLHMFVYVCACFVYVFFRMRAYDVPMALSVCAISVCVCVVYGVCTICL